MMRRTTKSFESIRFIPKKSCQSFLDKCDFLSRFFKLWWFGHSASYTGMKIFLCLLLLVGSASMMATGLYETGLGFEGQGLILSYWCPWGYKLCLMCT